MNRNFIKISVSIVALLLALAFCMTGCKVDDVAADLGTAKDEIAANKADAAKALEEATKALEEKIAANETDCAAEIAAVNAAIAEAQKASDASDAALETAIADAKAALNTAIKAVQADLEAAKTALSDKIAANTAELNEEIAALVAALENIELAYQAADLELEVAISTYIDECYATLEAAIAVVAGDVKALTEYVEDAVEALEKDIAAGNKNLLDSIAAVNNAITLAQAKAETADAALKEALEQAIADASKAIVEAVDVIKEDLQGKIDTLNESVSTIDNTISVTIAGQINDINDAIDAINADTTLADAIDAVEADIEALYTTIATYQETTEEVVKAWHEIYTTYQLWEQVNVSYGDMYVLDAEGNKVSVDIAAEYASAQVRLYRALNAEEVATIKADFFAIIRNVKSDTLDALNEIYAKLVAAETELGAEAPNLTTVRENLDAASEALAEYEEAKLIVDGVVVDLNKKYDAIWDNYNAKRVAIIEGYLAADNLDAARAGILDLVKDGEDATDLIAAYNAKRVANVEALNTTANNAIESAETVDALNATLDAELKDVVDAILDLKNDTDITVPADSIDALVEKFDATQINYLSNYIDFAEAGIAAAVVLDDLADDKAILDEVAVSIDNGKTAGIDLEDLEEEYDAALAAYYDKYVTIYAANLTANMNAYNDNLAAIYAEIKNDTTAIDDIRDDYDAFIDNSDYAAALQRNAESEALVALAEAEAAFVETEQLYLDLIEGVAAAEDVAAILDSEEFDEITGTKSEFEVIKEYRTESAEWIVSLDAFYTNFTDNEANKAAYTEIRALINETEFTAINTTFEAQIADLMDAADAVTKAMETLEAAVEDGYKLTTVEDIEAAYAAVNAWIGLATDPDGVAFILDWRSNGELTHEMLIKTVNAIDTEYKKFLANAVAEWEACYTEEIQALVEGTADLTVYENGLDAVNAWFEKYGKVDEAYVEAHNLGNVGTTEIAADIAELATELEALVAEAAEEAEALQTRIDELGFITTDSETTVETLRADYDAWIEAYGIDVDNEKNEELGLVVDVTALEEAETKLADLATLNTKINIAIAALAVPTLGDDYTAPYFATADAQAEYAASVNAIVADLATFEELNDGYRGCFTEENLTKVADCQLYADKYTALVTLATAYDAIYAEATDDTVKAQLLNYLNNIRATVDAIYSDTANASAIILFYGNQAEADMLEIANNAEDPDSGSSGTCEHTYDDACDTDCNKCGETRTVAGHAYDDDCDADCNNCGVTREAPHAWENACDAECDCGETRTITHADADGDFACDTVGCGVEVLPAADSTLTIEQATALATYLDGSYTTDKYYVTCIITSVYNTTYGNMNVADEDGNTFVIYGTYSADGEIRYDALSVKPVKGDTITVYGVIGSYNGAAQMMSGWITEHVAHTCNYEDATCTVAATCTICGATDGDALGHTEANAEGLCDRCGATLVSSATYVKVTSSDDFTSGTYVIIASNGAALGALDGNWVTVASPTVVDDTVTDAVGATWTVAVDGSSVTLQDANGTYIAPKSGNNNGIQSGEYSWAWVWNADGTVTFNGTGSDTTTLASNTGSDNKFRAYKTTTVSGNAAGYPNTFVVYKLA